MVDQCFLPFDAQCIKAIPICATRQYDCVTWPRHRGGEYTVKTSYQLLCEEASAETASSSDVVATKNFWARIWKLKVPHKVRIFLWRACSTALPTKGKSEEKENPGNHGIQLVHRSPRIRATCHLGMPCSSSSLGFSFQLGY